jgi:hypothetical protein
VCLLDGMDWRRRATVSTWLLKASDGEFVLVELSAPIVDCTPGRKQGSDQCAPHELPWASILIAPPFPSPLHTFAAARLKGPFKGSNPAIRDGE